MRTSIKILVCTSNKLLGPPPPTVSTKTAPQLIKPFFQDEDKLKIARLSKKHIPQTARTERILNLEE